MNKLQQQPGIYLIIMMRTKRLCLEIDFYLTHICNKRILTFRLSYLMVKTMTILFFSYRKIIHLGDKSNPWSPLNDHIKEMFLYLFTQYNMGDFLSSTYCFSIALRCTQ